MTTQYSQQRLDLLIFLATSQRVELERNLAQITAQKGHRHDALDALRRLGQEVQDAINVLSGLPNPTGGDAATFLSVESMLTHQLVLIATQLSDLEEEMTRLYGGAPPATKIENFPPVFENQEPLFPPTVPIEAFPPAKNSWPTADPNYSRPALKPIQLKQYDGGPRAPGDMSGAVHIRRQLDAQEVHADRVALARWRIDIGLDLPPPRNSPRKRPGEDLVPDGPIKRRHPKDDRYPSGTLRGGRRNSGELIRKKGILDRIKDVFKRPQPQGKYGAPHQYQPGQYHYAENEARIQASRAQRCPPRVYATMMKGPICRNAINQVCPAYDTQEEAEACQWLQETTRKLLDLLWTVAETPSTLHQQKTPVQDYQRREQMQRAFLEFSRFPLERIDLVEARRELRELRMFAGVLRRLPIESAMNAEEQVQALERNAEETRIVKERIMWQEWYVSLIFEDEKTAALFASWIRKTRERYEAELRFGLKAGMPPVPKQIGDVVVGVI